MTAAGLAPRMQQFLDGMDRLAREQYVDFARLRRFRQSVICRVDAEPSQRSPAESAGDMHAAASMTLVRAATEGKAFADTPADANARATRHLLQWLVREAPRIVSVAEASARLTHEAATDASSAKPVAALLAEACYAGSVDLYTTPPPLAARAGERPQASALVRWQVARQMGITNLRHESMRIDDRDALSLLARLDGTRTRSELAALAHKTPEAIEDFLGKFALHGLLVA